MYEEAPKNPPLQKTMEEKISLRAKSNLGTSAKTRRCQTHQVSLHSTASFGWINWEMQGLTCSSMVLLTMWTRIWWNA